MTANINKCLSQVAHLHAYNVLTPLQVKVGVEVGCEAIIHSVTHILERGYLPPQSQWILLLDFSNAFNSVNREDMFCEIHAKVAMSVELCVILL